MQNASDLPILIVGAGLVGLSAAVALAKQNFNVTLLNAQSWTPFQLSSPYALRVSAITHQNLCFLQQLHLLSRLPDQRIAPFQKISVGPEFLQEFVLHFSADEVDQSYLGMIIENHLLQQVLWDELATLSNIEICMPAEVSHWEMQSDRVLLHLTNGQIKYGKLLIGADGAQSKLRQFAGITVKQKSYQEHAAVATIHTEKPHQFTAWQRFLAAGPIALLPLAEPHYCSLVWTLPSSQCEPIQNLTDIAFSAQLQQAFGNALGKLTTVSERLFFPLQQLQATHYIGTRLALLGDAAHVIHPMAGQGVNLGFGDVQDLVNALLKARAQSRDIGHQITLGRYERAARARAAAMLMIVDGLHAVFQVKNPLLTSIRDWGLKNLASLAPLKKCMVRYAMGRTEYFL